MCNRTLVRLAPAPLRRLLLEPPCDLSIVIPCYNEAGRLGPTLERLATHGFGMPHEVLVVDDGSQDGTAEVARRHPGCRVIGWHANRGKGAAVRAGMLAARGRWILMSDADLSTPLEEFARLREALARGGGVAIASRGLPGAVIERPQPPYRVLMGKTYNLLVQAMLLPGIWDTQCGFKLFERAAARAIFTRTRLDGFGFDAEALYVARRLGYDVTEVPVRWRHEPETKVSAWRDSLRMLRELGQIRRLHRKLQPLAACPRDLRAGH